MKYSVKSSPCVPDGPSRPRRHSRLQTTLRALCKPLPRFLPSYKCSIVSAFKRACKTSSRITAFIEQSRVLKVLKRNSDTSSNTRSGSVNAAFTQVPTPGYRTYPKVISITRTVFRLLIAVDAEVELRLYSCQECAHTNLSRVKLLIPRESMANSVQCFDC